MQQEQCRDQRLIVPGQTAANFRSGLALVALHFASDGIAFRVGGKSLKKQAASPTVFIHPRANAVEQMLDSRKVHRGRLALPQVSEVLVMAIGQGRDNHRFLRRVVFVKRADADIRRLTDCLDTWFGKSMSREQPVRRRRNLDFCISHVLQV